MAKAWIATLRALAHFTEERGHPSLAVESLPEMLVAAWVRAMAVVTVAASSTVTLPFTTLLTGRAVVVRADASAVLRAG